MQAETRVNAEQASKETLRKPTRRQYGEGRRPCGKRATTAPSGSAGVMAAACMHKEIDRNTGSPSGGGA